MATDPRIDEYIAKAKPFAQPILTHLRGVIHAALPDAVETIKWGMPHFTIGGKNIAGLAAFKAHTAFVIHGEGRQGGAADEAGMGQYGKITSMDDLPPDAELREKLVSAVARAASPVKKPAKPPKAEIPMPDDLKTALAANSAASATFDGFAPSAKRDYLEWIVEAKRAETREKRVAQAVEWMAEGKKRHWKYENC